MLVASAVGTRHEFQRHMKRTLKNAVLRTLRSTGVFSVSSRLRKDSLVILCYHGISLRDEHAWEGGLYIPPDRFRQALEWLRDWSANVLPLGEALNRLRTGTLPPRSVVLTFDDGFYDFYRFAWPLLSGFGYPCTLYLTTYYTRYRLPIFNLVVSYLIWKGSDSALSREARYSEVQRHMDRAAALNLTTEGKDAAARQLADSLGIDYDEILRDRLFQIMAPDEVRAVAEGGIDIQLHTHRHRTPTDRDLFIREIRDNAQSIRELTGQTPTHFCYPSGVTSSEFLPWLNECGIESATTCVPGLARADTDPLLLPRYLDGCGVARLDFESWLCGLR
jgi:peptidoglycan/xylan/chitin deacetylase (PgdA/CDA1 family)